MDEFKWRFGSGFHGPAGPVARHLAQLKSGHGGTLTPALVLQDATNRSSPLHHLFEWNDRAAAHEHRLWQVGRLITSLMVVSESKSGGHRVVPAFTDVASNDRESHECPEP